ncbi:MAG: transposase [Pirellulales bacterium]
MLPLPDVVPGMIAAIQTFGQLLHWNLHIHSLVTCGAYAPEGEFLHLPEFDMDRLLLAWQEAVFTIYLSEGKIESEVVENMRSWDRHRRAAMVDGFSVDQSVLLSAGDQAGIERLVQYMVRCPFSLSRLVKVTDTGQVVYKAEKQACQAFPDPRADDLEAGTNRNFLVLSPLDFLAEFTQHIPPKGSHLIRYYGWYSNKSRGMRKNAEVETSTEPRTESEENASTAAATRCSQTWAMLIKRVYEADPLSCPQCGGQMKMISFIDPPQRDVIEQILQHCRLGRRRQRHLPGHLLISPDANRVEGVTQEL